MKPLTCDMLHDFSTLSIAKRRSRFCSICYQRHFNKNALLQEVADESIVHMYCVIHFADLHLQRSCLALSDWITQKEGNGPFTKR